MAHTGLDLIVTRTDLSQARVVPSTFPDPLPDCSCLLEIDSFALTANNITYGVAADMLGYWDFFPTGDAETGRIPVWGFARVVASAHAGVPVGTRVYGYLPMSTHVLVYPDRVTPQGFMDGVAHRAARAPIYNHYALTDADPQWQPEAEPLISLFRPLFTTSFLLEDLHRENGYFGAETVILSSASSKTAIGLAHLLARARPEGLRIVGLTSPGNRSFVQGLGCYDLVLGYDELDKLPDGPAAYVDMAGNADLRRKVHTRLGDALKSSRAVGMTHWQASGGLGGDLPGPRPEFFFAPAYAQERLAALGHKEFQARLGAAWADFIAQAEGWVEVSRFDGPEAVMARYLASQRGDIAPQQGHILSLHAR
jgi:hypothetical protein